ncbi:MAG: T9SS type A sorting domain-containing protein [Bacteroidia bacterium]|nr:T9SS type A sorting domain-containing protein [Bacteroidia bacterium]
MKRIWTLLLLTGLWFSPAMACSYFVSNFCEMGHPPYEAPEFVLVRATVAGQGNHYVDLAIQEVWRGTETRTHVRVWDMGSFDCNGDFFNGNADQLGQPGDQVWAWLYPIDTAMSAWETPGDYRAFHDKTNRWFLQESAGLITGAVTSYEPDTYTPAQLLNVLSGCVDNLLETPFIPQAPEITFRAANQEIAVFSTVAGEISLEIFDLAGRSRGATSGNSEGVFLSTAPLSGGVYVVRVRQNGLNTVRKILVP